MRVRATLDGIPISRRLPYAERFDLAWTLGDGTWVGNHTLLLAPAGAAHAFMAYWNEAWEFRGWYVNLQEPLRRSRFGFDSADHVLDIVIEPNLSTWTWKDEDELREAIALGRFTAEEADELYREGERAVAAVEARSWPFDRDWASWRPEPGWPAPVLVEGSDEP